MATHKGFPPTTSQGRPAIMVTEATETVICVDFGMTGSVAKWRTHGMGAEWLSDGGRKVPTKVAYGTQGNDGPPIAWGKQCDAVPLADVKECFKAWIGAATFSNTPDTMPWDPVSQLELHRWVGDYLRAFCAHIIYSIGSLRGSAWLDGTVIWNFTVPGCWAALPVVADFKRLVEDAVSPSFQYNPALRICCEATEGMASAQCLLEEASTLKEAQYAIGNVVISCDIGGATTDVAISMVISPGRLSTWPQLKVESVGTVTILKAFWLHAKDTLRRAGAQNPERLALEMARDNEFMRMVTDFTKGENETAIDIEIPGGGTLQQSPSLETPTPSKSTIYMGRLYIHRTMFESFFTRFVEQIEAAVDEAINTVTANNRQPVVIGFCGGGSRILYALQRLHRRYGDSIPILDYTQLSFPPEMATVRGSTLLWDHKALQQFVDQAHFGIETSDGINWKRPGANISPSRFNLKYAWIVDFDCNKHGRQNEHRIIAVQSTTDLLPGTFSDALRLPSSKSWTLKINLQKVKTSTLSWNRKYRIVCNIVGPLEIDFRVESIVPGSDAPGPAIHFSVEGGNVSKGNGYERQEQYSQDLQKENLDEH